MKFLRVNLHRQKNKSHLKNQSGQLIVEAVLLMVIMMAVFAMLQAGIKKMDLVGKLTREPWEKISGMIQCGVWQPCGIGQPVPNMHPSTQARVITLKSAQEPTNE